jgi:DNA-binding MarR family transcriptional regulator
VTDITKRLENRGYIARKKREDDRRAVSIFLTEKGQGIIKNLPPLLQETFTEHFSDLEDWEQMMIISAFERVVSMMAADKLEVSPFLVTGPHPA